MTTFKHPRGTTWRYDFWWRGQRYTGTTDQLTKEDADLVEAEIKKRVRQQAWGLAPVDRDRTPRFSEWAGHYYAHQQRRLTRPDSLKRALRMVLAFWGARPSKQPVKNAPYHDLRLADPILEPAWLERFEQWMEARGIAGGTKNTYRSALSGLFRLAMRPSWRKQTQIQINPVAGVERDRPRSRLATLTVEQLQAWIRAAAPHVRVALAIGALAPKLRQASILHLRWETHFDRALTFITVYDHKTIRADGQPQVVPIDPQLLEILKPLQRVRGPVISFRGAQVKSIKTALKRAAKDAGIDYGRHAITFHSLRHTMATLLAELGVPEKQRQLVMGHTDLRTTQLYTHLRPISERAPLAQLSGQVALLEAVQGPVHGQAVDTNAQPKHIRIIRGGAKARPSAGKY